MGSNSCNHEHKEEIEEDTICCRGGEEDICQNKFREYVSDIAVISSYLEFKGYSAVPD